MKTHNDNTANDDEPDCTASDLRTAARLVRWASMAADKQLASMPIWKRIFESYPESYLRQLVFNFEAMADIMDAKKENA